MIGSVLIKGKDYEAADPAFCRGGQAEARRGGQNRSIWGDLDLSALAAEAMATPSTVEPAVVAPPDDRRPSALDGEIAAAPFAEAVGEADICPETDKAGVADEVGRVETPTSDRIPRRTTRVRRRPERALPRGERWKLRLPKALREKR